MSLRRRSGAVIKKYSSRDRTAAAIGAFVRRQLAPVVSILENANDLAKFRERAGRMCVVGIVRNATAAPRALYDTLASVATRVEDTLFALLSDAAHDEATPHIALLRTFDEPRLFFTGALSDDKVFFFVNFVLFSPCCFQLKLRLHC